MSVEAPVRPPEEVTPNPARHVNRYPTRLERASAQIRRFTERTRNVAARGVAALRSGITGAEPTPDSPRLTTPSVTSSPMNEVPTEPREQSVSSAVNVATQLGEPPARSLMDANQPQKRSSNSLTNQFINSAHGLKGLRDTETSNVWPPVQNKGSIEDAIKYDNFTEPQRGEGELPQVDEDMLVRLLTPDDNTTQPTPYDEVYESKLRENLRNLWKDRKQHDKEAANIQFILQSERVLDQKKDELTETNIREVQAKEVQKLRSELEALKPVA